LVFAVTLPLRVAKSPSLNSTNSSSVYFLAAARVAASSVAIFAITSLIAPTTVLSVVPRLLTVPILASMASIASAFALISVV
jgi:hypothetical protein